MANALPSARHGGSFETSRFCGLGEVANAAANLRRLGNQAFPQSGMALAVSKIPFGVPLLSTQRSGRGGARNNARRQSTALTKAQLANLSAAERHAAKMGFPLTRMITIHWEAAGLPLAGMARATGRFVDLLTKALKRHGSTTAWIWVHENCGSKGGHCHLLAHVPAALVPVVRKLQIGWLSRITGKPYRKNVIHSDPIGGRLALEVSNPELHAANLSAALGYVFKGAGREAAVAFALKRIQSGGCVIGKRCGTSQNIGAKARRSGATT